MSRHLKFVMMALSAVTLVNCGGSGGGPNASTGTFLQRTQSALDLANKYPAIDYTPVLSIPTSGAVQYDGFMVATIEYPGGEVNAAIGDMRLSADFSSDTISGRASNFVDIAEINYTGGIDVSNGVINRVDGNFAYQMNADASGVLTDENAVAYTISGTLRGDFFGANLEAIDGELTGTSDSIYGLAVVSGGFIGER